MMLGQELGDSCQIVSNDAPADPTFHTYFAMRQAAIQMAGASQLANAAFDPIAEPLGGAKPGLPFVVAATIRLITWLGQADMIHPQSLRLLLVVGRVNAAITTDFFRWFAKDLAVIAQAGDQQRRFIGITLQETIFANQPSIDFGIPNFATKLGVFGFGFAATDEAVWGSNRLSTLSLAAAGFPCRTRVWV